MAVVRSLWSKRMTTSSEQCHRVERFETNENEKRRCHTKPLGWKSFLHCSARNKTRNTINNVHVQSFVVRWSIGMCCIAATTVPSCVRSNRNRKLFKCVHIYADLCILLNRQEIGKGENQMHSNWRWCCCAIPTWKWLTMCSDLCCFICEFVQKEEESLSVDTKWVDTREQCVCVSTIKWSTA